MRKWVWFPIVVYFVSSLMRIYKYLEYVFECILWTHSKKRSIINFWKMLFCTQLFILVLTIFWNQNELIRIIVEWITANWNILNHYEGIYSINLKILSETI